MFPYTVDVILVAFVVIWLASVMLRIAQPELRETDPGFKRVIVSISDRHIYQNTHKYKHAVQYKTTEVTKENVHRKYVEGHRS